MTLVLQASCEARSRCFFSVSSPIASEFVIKSDLHRHSVAHSANRHPRSASELRNNMNQSSSAKTCLIMAHPGHELRIHGWLEEHRPDTYFLTDGSGRSGIDRLSFSRLTLTNAHCQLFGSDDVWSDSQAYEVFLSGAIETITRRISRVAEHIHQANICTVVCDAIEGFNPVHDLCTVMAAMACRLTQRRHGTVIRLLSFPLEGHPQSMATIDSVKFPLDSNAWNRKLRAIEQNTALQDEVERSFKRHGREAFQVEMLSPVDLESALRALQTEKPFYETHGEKRVATGAYSHVLRFQQHFQPLVSEIKNWVMTQ